MPDEAVQIIAHCEERLLKAKIITEPFIVAEIQGGILKEYLTDEDYLAPHKVNISFSLASCYRSLIPVYNRSPTLVNISENLRVANSKLISDFLLFSQQEEWLKARPLTLQEAVKQQIPQGVAEEAEGRDYTLSIPLWYSSL